MKTAACFDKSVESLLSENDALCRQLAKLQQRASELIQKRAAEVEQLNTVVEYLNAELHDKDIMILFLRAKLQEFRKMTELPATGQARNQLVCK
jgi:predicted RNase H-like nuclease (RuvC/YqgF family)